MSFVMKSFVRQRGFGLFELIISLAIIGVLVAGVLVYQARAEARSKASDTLSALVSMVSVFRDQIGSATKKNYKDLNVGSAIALGAVVPPFTVTTNDGVRGISSVWQTDVLIIGSLAAGAFGVKFQVPDSQTCLRLVPGLSKGALRLAVAGQDFNFNRNSPNFPGFLNLGDASVVWNGSSYSAQVAARQCALPNTWIGVVYR
jgi:prepilin-type N-terminal cleavage/methylation domain-containing protein